MKKLFLLLMLFGVALSPLYMGCNKVNTPTVPQFNVQTGYGIPLVNVDSNGICISDTITFDTNSQAFLDSIEKGISYSSQYISAHLQMDEFGKIKIPIKVCLPFKK